MKKHVPKLSLCKKLPKSFKTTWVWIWFEPNKDKWEWQLCERANVYRLRTLKHYPSPLADEFARELAKSNYKHKIAIEYFAKPNALCELYLWAVKEGYIKGR